VTGIETSPYGMMGRFQAGCGLAGVATTLKTLLPFSQSVWRDYTWRSAPNNPSVPKLT
jgi:hypothetical protein